MTIDDAKKIRIACLKHAADLIAAAKGIEPDWPHLAYHLAALALEEIGKTVMVISELHPRSDSESEERRQPWLDDHARKLFWAIWTPLFRTRIERVQVEETRDLAQRIHQIRLAGLYVDWVDEHVFTPSEMVDHEQAKRLVAMAETRLKMEESVELRDFSDSDRRLIEWFSESSLDREKRKFVFGKGSLEKLREFEVAIEWLRWLKDQFDEADRLSQESVVIGTVAETFARQLRESPNRISHPASAKTRFLS